METAAVVAIICLAVLIVLCNLGNDEDYLLVKIIGCKIICFVLNILSMFF